jgi:FkbM family methyltransferase
MSLKQQVFRALPRTSQVRVRYAYRYLLGKLDRELPLLRSLLDGRGTVIDVGAHEGIYSYGLLNKATVVEAFEPSPEPYKTLASFGGRLHAHRVALSDHEGTGILHVPHVNGRPETGLASLNHGSSSETSIEVPLKRLDSYEFREVVLLKIDVEGHEGAVLRGAEETIRRNRPVLCIEIEQRHLSDTTMQSQFDQLAQLGYDGFFVDTNDTVRSLREFSYEQHQAPYLADLLAHEHEYINNFVFVHRDDPRRARLGIVR